MHIDEINQIISQLTAGNKEAAIEMLKSERDRILQIRQLDSPIIQRTFERYASNIVVKNAPDWSNLYSYVDGLFTFTNGISLFQLRDRLEIIDKMRVRYQDDSKESHPFREAKVNEIDNMLEKCKELIGNNKLLVEFQSRSVKKNRTTYESGHISHIFDMKQTDYIETFLGRDAKVYISGENPVAYAQSDRGTGYVLGYRGYIL